MVGMDLPKIIPSKSTGGIPRLARFTKARPTCSWPRLPSYCWAANRKALSRVLMVQPWGNQTGAHNVQQVAGIFPLIFYGLMAMLVVEQGRTIDSQSFLIRALFRDSTELTGMKSSVIQKQRAQAQAQAE